MAGGEGVDERTVLMTFAPTGLEWLASGRLLSPSKPPTGSLSAIQGRERQGGRLSLRRRSIISNDQEEKLRRLTEYLDGFIMLEGRGHAVVLLYKKGGVSKSYSGIVAVPVRRRVLKQKVLTSRPAAQ